jgi:hypothetical protein
VIGRNRGKENYGDRSEEKLKEKGEYKVRDGWMDGKKRGSDGHIKCCDSVRSN